ncbi:MAG: hypothetical protein PF482_04035 [Desulfobacteraceae bacterium]|jgi:iron-sulfur cluster assembly protein|nr:hypothetical protein [Desulfobacteraceae bacterium]
MDEIFEFNGYKFIANKDLLSQTQPITVDFKGVGFQIDSNLQMSGGGCSSCSTDGSCG